MRDKPTTRKSVPQEPAPGDRPLVLVVCLVLELPGDLDPVGGDGEAPLAARMRRGPPPARAQSGEPQELEDARSWVEALDDPVFG